MRRAIALIVCAGVVLSLLLACGCKSGGSSGGGGNTPEKAKQQMLEATGGKGIAPPKAETSE